MEVTFGGGDVFFRGATFGDGNISFEQANFGDGDVSFMDATFSDGEVNFIEATFGRGDIDFRDVDFGKGGVSFECTRFGRGDVDFAGASFEKGIVGLVDATFEDGDVDFSGVDFINCKEILFERTNFGDGDVNFSGVTFNSEIISFNSSTFGNGLVDFTRGCFNSPNTEFEEVDFGNGDIIFYKADFCEGDVDFLEANFGDGDIIFKQSKCYDGKIRFDQATFGKGDIDFSFTRYNRSELIFKGIKNTSGKFTILDATCKEVSFGGATLYGDLDARVEKVQLLDFKDTILYANTDLGSHLKGGNTLIPKVEKLNLINTKLYGKIHLDYEDFGLEDAINNQIKSTHKQKADQFRLLKENFRSLGQYDDEDKAYVQFRKHWLQDQYGREESESFWKVTKGHPSYPFKFYLFEKVGLYGTSPMQVIKNMGLWVAIFSLFYWPLANSESLNLPECLPVWFTKLSNGIYHSIITFLTIGYGDRYVYPGFWGKLLSGIEGFMGLFLMSYFTISFVRKVLR